METSQLSCGSGSGCCSCGLILNRSIIIFQLVLLLNSNINLILLKIYLSSPTACRTTEADLVWLHVHVSLTHFLCHRDHF